MSVKSVSQIENYDVHTYVFCVHVSNSIFYSDVFTEMLHSVTTA